MSVVNTELSLKSNNIKIMIMIYSQLTSYSAKRNTFILNCFIQFMCINLDGCQNKGGNFLNLLQKVGLPKKGGGGGGGGWGGGGGRGGGGGGGGGGLPQKRREFQPWRKL